MEDDLDLYGNIEDGPPPEQAQPLGAVAQDPDLYDPEDPGVKIFWGFQLFGVFNCFFSPRQD